MVSRTRRTLEAVLFPAWEHWVVRVPEADNVHAIVMERTQAERVATAAAALILDVEESTLLVVVSDGSDLPEPPSNGRDRGRPAARD